MNPLNQCAFILLVFLLLAIRPLSGMPQADSERWQKELEAFARQDQQQPPEKGGIVFVGSSSIRLWEVERFFPGLKVLNRGFGGSQLSDVLQHLDRLVLAHRPRLVVVYAGDNDIAAGEQPSQVAREFTELAQRLHEALPQSRLVYLSIKPSLARWQLFPQMQQANEAIERYCQSHDRCEFVDVSRVMLDGEGKPRADLLVDDGLHLNESGYRLWSDLVRPLLRD
jgi:lysophospholipase L1-like esterase